jgi:hypothetical protein
LVLTYIIWNNNLKIYFQPCHVKKEKTQQLGPFYEMFLFVNCFPGINPEICDYNCDNNKTTAELKDENAKLRLDIAKYKLIFIHLLFFLRVRAYVFLLLRKYNVYAFAFAVKK